EGLGEDAQRDPQAIVERVDVEPLAREAMIDLGKVGQLLPEDRLAQLYPAARVCEVAQGRLAFSAAGVGRQDEHRQAAAARVNSVGEPGLDQDGPAFVGALGNEPERAVDA